MRSTSCNDINNDQHSSDDNINGAAGNADSKEKKKNHQNRKDPLPVHTAHQSPAGLLCDIEDDTTHNTRRSTLRCPLGQYPSKVGGQQENATLRVLNESNARASEKINKSCQYMVQL